MCLNVGIPNSHSASISFTFYLLCVIKLSVVTTNIEEIKRDYPGPSTIYHPLDIWTVDILAGGGGGGLMNCSRARLFIRISWK